MCISFNGVTFGYSPSKKIFTNFSFKVPTSGRICLTGKSGCGKTTLLRLIAGLEKPESGQIKIPKNINFSFVFQEDRLLPWLTAEENVALVTRDTKAVERAFEAVNLTEFKKEYPNSLSGGMRRRVAIARALAFCGDILLLDEPFTGIDMENKSKIAENILKIYNGKPIILVSHIKEDAELLKAEILALPGDARI